MSGTKPKRFIHNSIAMSRGDIGNVCFMNSTGRNPANNFLSMGKRSEHEERKESAT